MSEAEEKKIIGKTALEHFETETFAVPDIEGHERRKRRRRGSTLNGSRVLPTDHEPDAGEASKVQAEVIQYPCLKRLLLAVVLRIFAKTRRISS